MQEQEVKQAELKVEQEMAALKTLSELVFTGSGGSQTAASVLLHAWNGYDYPIHNLRALSGRYREAAFLVIQGICDHGFRGGDEVERRLGYETVRDISAKFSHIRNQ